jgi:hypothetical protein
VIFLIAEGLDGCCIEYTFPLGKGFGNEILADKGLSTAGFRSYKHVLSRVNAENRLFLERVELIGRC